MKAKTTIGVTALAGAALLACAGTALAVDWRGWNIHPEGYPNTIAMKQFADEVTEKMEGRVTATVYDSAVLGDQPDAIEQTRNGALDFANFNMGPMGPIIPVTNVLSLPFLFKDAQHMYRVMDGEIGARLSEGMEEYGLVSLAWYDSGSRSFYNAKHPIAKPEDVKGLKIRVMNNDLYVGMVGELGGNATPMAFGEVYQSLKTGVIDGAENNYASFDSTGHYEVARYYSITDHLIIPECVCIAKSSWDALSPEDQEIVRQAAVRSAETQRKLFTEQVMASHKKVEEAGVTINEVDDKAAFQEAMEPVYAKFIAENPNLEPLIKAIRETE
ncbi:TRAP transporter substrate-binding protein [Nitratireductor sp. ZSWI3]|uniref:TRAP transporter substrate-binding protein n=1 Tax=Nitratireductor sp. ZSWI3 TaxID=2966359 RepID=UPI00214FF110|nr:TRAP transporter substrate-binding protein [Nitratireductor sp. ZSWI3]MCR4268505.1 TRAP transporter substrate-binding protein [Nitratireductor sp. ZSWI3]